VVVVVVMGLDVAVGAAAAAVVVAGVLAALAAFADASLFGDAQPVMRVDKTTSAPVATPPALR